MVAFAGVIRPGGAVFLRRPLLPERYPRTQVPRKCIPAAAIRVDAPVFLEPPGTAWSIDPARKPVIPNPAKRVRNLLAQASFADCPEDLSGVVPVTGKHSPPGVRSPEFWRSRKLRGAGDLRWHPSRMRDAGGLVRWCRFAQPPATGWVPSGNAGGCLFAMLWPSPMSRIVPGEPPVP